MYRRSLLIALLPLISGCHGQTHHDAPLSSQSQAEVDQRYDPADILEVTRIEPGTDVRDFESDSFTLGHARIRGDVLELTVRYSGGASEHDFALYWAGLSTRSMPPQYPMVLKHRANGETAEVWVTDIVRFDLSALPKPYDILIRTDHGGNARIRSD